MLSVIWKTVRRGHSPALDSFCYFHMAHKRRGEGRLLASYSVGTPRRSARGSCAQETPWSGESGRWYTHRHTPLDASSQLCMTRRGQLPTTSWVSPNTTPSVRILTCLLQLPSAGSCQLKSSVWSEFGWRSQETHLEFFIFLSTCQQWNSMQALLQNHIELGRGRIFKALSNIWDF